MKDYARFKALAKELVECIGDDEEGENPSLPKQDNEVNKGGVEANTSFLKTSESKESETGVGASKKGKKESSLAVMAATLASKVKK